MFRKELDGLVDRHFQYVVNVFSFELHFQRVVLDALAVARLTFQHQVGHELHFYRYRTFSLAFFATSAFRVEREIACAVSHLLGQRLVGKQFADFVIRLDVSHRITSGRLSDRVLVHKLDVVHLTDVSFQ